ncbi:MAG: hypothetical protein ABI577_08220 [bacterium]
MTRPGDNSRLVYSTDGGKVRDTRPPVPQRTQSRPGPVAAPKVPDDGIVRIQRDKKGRGGKTATTITGLPGSETDLDALLKALKQHCGTGGSREGRTLVLQGDMRDRLLERMIALGHKAKLAGG